MRFIFLVQEVSKLLIKTDRKLAGITVAIPAFFGDTRLPVENGAEIRHRARNARESLRRFIPEGRRARVRIGGRRRDVERDEVYGGSPDASRR